MDKRAIQAWVRFIAGLIGITLGIMVFVFVVCLLLGWTESDQYYTALFYISAALLIIGGFSIQSAWSGIRQWTYAMSQTAGEPSSSDRAKTEIRDINQALGTWGKLSLVGALLLAITLIAG